jgi:uncharacterized membrane protein YoaT (DUF817 family)
MVGHTYLANSELGYQFENHKKKATVYLFHVLCFTLQIFQLGVQSFAQKHRL